MVRVCPKRDAECPYGDGCPYWIDRHRCAPETADKMEPVGVRCVNCGSNWDDERLRQERAIRSSLRSCCPERKMVDVYTADQVKELTDRLESLRVEYYELDLNRERAEAALAEASKVIEPFAKRAGKLDGLWADHETGWSPAYGSTVITIGDLRAASTWFEANKGDA